MGIAQTEHAYDLPLYAHRSNLAAKVRMGGNAAAKGGRFVPNINISKWDDECWINLNFPEIITDEQETFDGEKVIIALKDYVLRYYPHNENELEWEFIFGNVPETDTISINMLCSESLKFYYQPPLTQLEIDGGAKRPENVVGSYAVYAKKKNGKYCTGKFLHIYYPYLTDADGKEIRAESFVIDKGKMHIGLPMEWMKNAKYPVVLDPTLGNEHVGASSNSIGKTRCQTTNEEATDASGGTVQTYHIAISAEYKDTTLKCGIYAISGGLPTGNPVDQATGAASVSDDCSFAAGGGTLSPSTTYTIALTADYPLEGDDYLCDYKYDTGSAGDSSLKTGTTYAAEFTSPAGDYGGNTEVVTMWCDYAPASGGEGISVQTIG